MQAIWNETLLAESDATVELDGEVYFPASSVDMDYLEASTHQTTSPEKGKTRFYHVVVEGQRNENAAWYYSDVTDATQGVEDCIAFGNDVEVRE